MPRSGLYSNLRAADSHATSINNLLSNDVRNYAPVPWYWRLLAVLSALMILGGFLMLPSAFDNDPQAKISQTGVAIFGLALLTAGLSVSVLVFFSVPQSRFKADALFLPCLASSAIGLLNVFYNFVISARYYWNIPAYLTTIGAAIASIVYGVFFTWSHLKAKATRKANMAARTSTHIPLNQTYGRQSPAETADPLERSERPSVNANPDLWQDSSYYQNYNRNMYPSTFDPGHSVSSQPNKPVTPPAQTLTEEEMTRRQMLNLLVSRDRPDTADASAASTYNIDWHDQDQETSPSAARRPGPFPTSTPQRSYDGRSRGYSDYTSNSGSRTTLYR